MTAEDTRLTESPLHDVSPYSLQDLFDKDPFSLTDQDVEKIVAELRMQRANWATLEKEKENKPKRATAVSKKALPVGLSLTDLLNLGAK